MDDIDGILGNSYVSNTLRQARGMVNQKISQPIQPNRFKQRSLFSESNDHSRRRERSCNIDMDMRKTVHDWSKVFSSSNGFKQQVQPQDEDEMLPQDLNINFNINNPNPMKNENQIRIRRTNSLRKPSSKTSLNNIPKHTTMKAQMMNTNNNISTNNYENKENTPEEELSHHDESYIKKVTYILSTSKDICKNYDSTNEDKYVDSIDTLYDKIETMLGTYSMVSAPVLKKYPLSKVVLCLRNLMRFNNISLQVKLILATFKVVIEVGLIFDPAEKVNDYYKIDSNLFHCVKLLLKYSKSKEYDDEFRSKQFLRTYVSLVDSIVKGFYTQLHKLLEKEEKSYLVEYDEEKDRTASWEEFVHVVKYRIELPYEFLIVSLGFIKNLTQERDIYMHMDELNIYHTLEPMLTVNKLNRQLFSPYDDSQEYADVLVQTLGILRNVVAFEANYNNFLYNNWVNYLHRVLQHFSYSDELVSHALNILSMVSSCRNVCAIMKSVNDFNCTLANLFLLKENSYTIMSNISYVLSNMCSYFPNSKHDCYFAYDLNEQLPKLISNYTDKLVMCYEDTSSVSKEYVAELEDGLSKILNFLNVLLLEEEIAKDSLKRVELFNDVVDLLNSSTENQELHLVCINFVSIVSFYDSEQVLDDTTRIDIIDALKIFLTNTDKQVLIECMRAMTNLSREAKTYATISDELVLQSLIILLKHTDADVVYWVLAVVVNISCHYDHAFAPKCIDTLVESLLEAIYSWQNRDAEMATMGVMNLINLCERKYQFNSEHIDTLSEVKTTCTLEGEEKQRLFAFYNELADKVSRLGEDESKDFQEIFGNIDTFIKNNCRTLNSLKEGATTSSTGELNANRSKQKLDVMNINKSDVSDTETKLKVEKTIEETKARNRNLIDMIMKEEEMDLKNLTKEIENGNNENTNVNMEEFLCNFEGCGRKFKNQKDLDKHYDRRHKN